MTAGMHRRPGQRRDAWHAWIRDARAVIRLTWLILATLISRRAHPRAAGGAPGWPPVAGAPEAPAPTPVPLNGAGASPRPPDAAPEGATAPATPGAAARPPWVTWHGPPGTPPPAPRLAPGRDTIAMPAVDAALRVRYAAAHEQERDRAVNQ